MGDFFLLLTITIAVFFLCREIMCWYWKINEHLDNQKKIIEKLDKLDQVISELNEIKRNTKKNPSSSQIPDSSKLM